MTLQNKTLLTTLTRGLAVAMLTISVGVSAPVAVADARNRCDVETLEGGYAFAANGFLRLGPDTLPTAALGDFTFDGEGNVAGVATQSVNGLVVQVPQTGTYMVNPDCSGSVVTNGNDGITRTFDFVIVGKGKEILVLATRPELVSAFSMRQK